ncbi:MAG: PilZ domain-containing protein, partial [Candidatus Eremiobacteraeota bacterium]|nr:PilZ domain-containing protein [Candidatus Eremiobacteraeota bacterium]
MGLLGKIFGKTKIEIVTFDPTDRAILFTAEKKLAEGEHQVQAQVADHSLKCKVRVESVEAELHYGQFLEPDSALEPLSVLLPRPKVVEDQRSAPRIDRIVRVCSAHIPHFQAVTTDLSLTGMKLKTEGSMEPESYFECQVEFDDHTMSRLDFTAQVRWCRQVEAHWEVGIQFVDTPKPTMSRLAYFIKALTEVERGVLKGSYQ